MQQSVSLSIQWLQPKGEQTQLQVWKSDLRNFNKNDSGVWSCRQEIRIDVGLALKLCIEMQVITYEAQWQMAPNEPKYN